MEQQSGLIDGKRVPWLQSPLCISLPYFRRRMTLRLCQTQSRYKVCMFLLLSFYPRLQTSEHGRSWSAPPTSAGHTRVEASDLSDDAPNFMIQRRGHITLSKQHLSSLPVAKFLPSPKPSITVYLSAKWHTMFCHLHKSDPARMHRFIYKITEFLDGL